MFRKGIGPILLIQAVLLIGCASHRIDTSWPAPRPLGDGVKAYRPSTSPPEGTSVEGVPKVEGPLTLAQALLLALVHNPELKAFAWDVRAAEARALQAGVSPNPEFEAEVEEFGGAGERGGFDGAAATFSLSQALELGKRSKRVAVADLEGKSAGWDYETKRIEAFSSVVKAFIDVLTAQENLALAGESVQLSERLLETVQKLHEIGKAPALEIAKAKVSIASSRIEHGNAARNLVAAKQRLAAIWGGGADSVDELSGDFLAVASAPPLADLETRLSQNPDLARYEDELRLRRAVVNLEKANRVPDLTVRGGVQRFGDADDTTFVVGVGIPLPIFDRNQGSVAAARFEERKALENGRAASLRLRTELTDAYQRLSAAHAEINSLNKEVIPQAQSAFQNAEEFYRMGRFSFLEVLDAQRTLYDARARLVEVLSEYHQSVAEIERLTGQTLNP
ncbi:MAG: TolC family protein [Deltaproteobacteria bacterium]|nr:TolC family protein [Deltaproteobacteria bacterium]